MEQIEAVTGRLTELIAGESRAMMRLRVKYVFAYTSMYFLVLVILVIIVAVAVNTTAGEELRVTVESLKQIDYKPVAFVVLFLSAFLAFNWSIVIVEAKAVLIPQKRFGELPIARFLPKLSLALVGIWCACIVTRHGAWNIVLWLATAFSTVSFWYQAFVRRRWHRVRFEDVAEIYCRHQYLVFRLSAGEELWVDFTDFVPLGLLQENKIIPFFLSEADC